jgi:hypothetical protein
VTTAGGATAAELAQQPENLKTNQDKGKQP